MQRLSMRFLYSFLAGLMLVGSLRAERSIIVDNQTGRILEGVGENRRVPVASLTKLALAMVALDWSELKGGNLDQTATVPRWRSPALAESIHWDFRPAMC